MADREIDNKKNPKKGVALDPNWEIINVGAAPNDGTGDPIRDAMVKVNKNFANIFAQDNKANTNAEYTWTNVHNFEANVYFNGNSTANIQFITSNGEMDARFFTKRVYFGGGNSGLEGGQITLGYKNDIPENSQGSWNIDVYGYSDANVSFQNALRIFNYDKNDTPHPFLHVNPVEGGTFADSANCIFSLSGYTDQIPFSVTFAKDIGPWEDKVQNFGSSSKKWNSVFAYNLYDVTNSKGVTGQVLSSTPEGIRWVNISGEKATQIIQQSFVGDGVTRNFTILGGYTPGLINVFLNGIRMTPATDVDISLGTDIVFVDPPELGMAIDVSGALMLKVSVDSSLPYTWTANQEFTAGIIASGSIGRNGQILSSTGTTVKWIDYAPGPISPQGLVKANINQSFIGDGTTKTFTITGGYTPGQLNVFLNGVRMSTSVEVDVSSGTVITFDSAPEKGMPIDTVGALFSNTTVDTSVPYSWTANQDFKSNVSIVGLKANGSLGSAGQVLTTNGSGTYWAAGGGGGGSVNTDAKYTWTNAHTFNVNGALNNNAITITGNAFSINSSGFINQFQIEFSNATNKSVLSSYGLQSNIILTTRISGSKAGTVNTDDLSIEAANVISANAILAPRKGIAANGNMGALGQILASNGNGIYWVDASAASVNTAAQYTWTNTHTFNANVTFNSNVGIGTSNAATPLYIKKDNLLNYGQIVIEPTNNVGQLSIIDTTITGGDKRVSAIASESNTTNKTTFLIYRDSCQIVSLGATGSSANSAKAITLLDANGNISLGKGGELGPSIILYNSKNPNPVSINSGVNQTAWEFTLPTSPGSSGQILSTDGNGNTSWVGAGGASVNTAASYTWTNNHIFQTNASFGAAATVGQRIVDITSPNGYIPIVRGDQDAGWQLRTESGGTKNTSLYFSNLNGGTLTLGSYEHPYSQVLANKEFSVFLNDGGSSEVLSVYKNQYGLDNGVLINKSDGPVQLGTLTVGSAGGGSGIAVKMNNDDKFMYTGSGSDGSYRFGVANDGSIYTRGKLGVGTNPTSYGITVQGDGSFTAIQATASGSSAIVGKSNGGGVYGDDSTGAYGILGFQNSSFYGEAARGTKTYINSTQGGNDFGLYTSGRIQSNATKSSGISGGTAVYMDGNGMFGYDTSIKAAKKNIKDLEDVNWLTNLRPVSYNFRKKNEKGEFLEEAETNLEVGLIAEEVAEVNKNFALYSNEGELQGVRYDRLVVPMLKMIQDLQKKVEVLEGRLKTKK